VDSPRIKVVYLDHVARLSGGEIALLRTLPALLDRVDPVVVLAEDGPLHAKLQAEGIRTVLLPLDPTVRDVRRDAVAGRAATPANALKLASYVLQVRALLRRERPDLVHTNSLKAALYGGLAGRLAGVPVIWHVRDRIASDYLSPRTTKVVRAAARILPTVMIANSQATLATLPRQGRSRVLHNPLVLDSVVVDQVRTREAAGSLVIGMLGRLAPWKGQDLFLEAFAHGAPATARARIIGSAMFGEDSYEQQLREQVAKLGLTDRVEFRGFREDVWAELAQLDVLVHASRVPEPFGQVVLEGMAAGLAVIASGEGGPAEIVADGVDGLLFTPRSTTALAEALNRVCADPALRAALGRAGRATAERYNPGATAEKLIAIYERVLSRRRRH
jgi:glycosyltransferase involved in cell wall biosynthesis